MQIWQFMDKEEQYQYQLICLVYQQPLGISLREAIECTKLSKQTLKKYINNLNERLLVSDLEAQFVLENDCLNFYISDETSWSELLDLLLESSLEYRIVMHLFKYDSFHVMKESQKMSVSCATLHRHLANLNILLAEFHISISQGKQIGEELQWRYFYYELFSQCLTTKKYEKMIQRLHTKPQLKSIERVCSMGFSQNTAKQLHIWLAISRQRHLMMKYCSHEQLEEKMFEYFQNIFYIRLKKIITQSFDGECDSTEAMVLFAFLISHNVVPLETMIYMLGFGGPISKYVTQALEVLSRSGTLKEHTMEQVIYGLGNVMSKAYFFRGKIVSQPANICYIEYMTSEKCKEILLDLVNVMCVLTQQHHCETLDLCMSCQRDLLEIIMYSYEKYPKICVIGLVLENNPIKQEMIRLKLLHYFDNHNFVQFKYYNEHDEYDFVIVEGQQCFENLTPYYRLKQDLSAKELFEIDQRIKELFSIKAI